MSTLTALRREIADAIAGIPFRINAAQRPQWSPDNGATWREFFGENVIAAATVPDAPVVSLRSVTPVAAATVPDAPVVSLRSVTPVAVVATAPGRVATPTVSAASSSSLDVSWAAPNDGGSAITDYFVRYRRQGQTSWTAGGRHTGGARSARITGLTANTTYEVQVLARNSVGDGQWSASGSGATSVAATVPDAPVVSLRSVTPAS